MRIIGHRVIQERLDRLAGEQSHPQSFLFVGPESVGKRLVALRFAWTLLGRGDEFDSRKEEDLTHPDIAFLAPERVTEKGKTHEKNIPVEAVRENIGFLSRYPLVGKKRILIIDDAHRLSHGAQNALLKTLEEPNETSVLILVTHDAAVLLDTVHSRLQRVSFSPVTGEEMTGLGSLDHADRFLLSFGRPGIVVKALRDTEGFSTMKTLLRRLVNVRELSVSERLRLAEDLARESASVSELLEWLAFSARKRAYEEGHDRVREACQFLEDIVKAQRVLRGTQANVRLQLEKLFLKSR